MSRKHFTKRQQRDNGWLDPRSTKEAHESRDMTNRKRTPMEATRKAFSAQGPGKAGPKSNKRGRR